MVGGKPKPVAVETDISEWEEHVPGILNDAKHFTNAELLENLKHASDYWTTDEVQTVFVQANPA